jgi:hypothetical protein
MEQDLTIKISVDAKTGALNTTNAALRQTASEADRAAGGIKRFRNEIDFIAHSSQAFAGIGAALSALWSPLSSAVREGIAYNSTLEQTQLALKATISGYIDAATGAERIAAAEAMAIVQMEALKVSAMETGVGFSDLSSAFKTFLPGALSVGMSMDQATKAAARLTQAAKIQGVEFGALIAGIDGVAKGTILANSDFGRFLSGLGLTNEALKEAANSGQTYELIMSRLGDIPAVAATGAKGYAASMSALNATIAELRGELTKPMFDAMAASAQSLNSFLTDNRETIKALIPDLKALIVSAVAFKAALAAIRNHNKIFDALGSAIGKARLAATGLHGGLSVAAARTSALAMAQRGLSTAFKATPWGLIFSGLAAIATYFLTASDAAKEAAESFDGTTESLEKLGSAQRSLLESDLKNELDDLKTQRIYMEHAGGGFFGFGRKYGVERAAEAEALTSKITEAEEKLKKLMEFNAAAQLPAALRQFDPAAAAAMISDLQTERDKAVFTELEKLEAKRQEMVDLAVTKIAPDTDEFRNAMILIGEIYDSELKKIDEKADQARISLLEKIDATNQTQIGKLKAQFASYKEEAAKLFDGDELKTIVSQLDSAEYLEIAKLKRAEYQKIVDEAIRANNAIKEIEGLAIDNAVLRNEITEEEANRKKQLLAYDIEILNIERQIAALDQSADATRISELEKTRDLLDNQKTLKAAEIIPSEFTRALADTIADAFTQGLLDGLKNGKLDAKGILGDMAGGLSQSFAAELNKSLSSGISTLMSGGGLGGFDPASMAANAAASFAMYAIQDVANAKWEVVETRDLLQEIVDNTAASVEAFKSYFTMARRFGGGIDTPFDAMVAVMKNANMNGEGGFKASDLTKALFGGALSSIALPLLGIDKLFGGAIGDLFGGAGKALESAFGGLFGSTKTSRKGFDGSLGSAKFLDIKTSSDQYLTAMQGYLLGWFDDYYDNIIKFNVEVYRETKKKKTLFGSSKKTAIYYTQLTEAELMLSAFLKQFGTDRYGALTAEGAKVFNEKMGALLAVTEGIDALNAALRGDTLSYNLEQAEFALAGATEYIAAIYNDALENAGVSLIETIIDDAGESYQALRDLSAAELAKSFENLDLSAIIGKYGAAINVDDLTSALESLQQAIAANIEAIKAYANAEIDRISSEASFVEWLGAADSAIESAAGSLRSFAEGLKSFAKQARDLVASARSDDTEFLQRQYLTARLAHSGLYDDDGAIRGDLSQQYIQDVMSGYLDAARSFQGAIGDYDFTARSALERELLAAADAVDLSADILSVKIVGDSVDLATNQTINDLIAALTPALALDQIGFTGTSDAAKRALALASGAKTQEELDNLVEAIATLRFGDDLSDAEYLANLAELA